MYKVNTLPPIIDVEASGFGAFSYPIEVGVALTSGDRVSLLIRPESEWTHWDSSAEQVHGLSRDLLMSKGKPIDAVAKMLNDLLEETTVYSDGWVVDKPWVSTLYHKAGIRQQFYLSPIEQIMQETQFEIWDAAKISVAEELGLTRHRASSDAWIIQKTYERTRASIAAHETGSLVSGRCNQRNSMHKVQTADSPAKNYAA